VGKQGGREGWRGGGMSWERITVGIGDELSEVGKRREGGQEGLKEGDRGTKGLRRPTVSSPA